VASNQVESRSLEASGGSGLNAALMGYADILHQDLSRNRFAEEREWYEEALFYQRRQWLKWDNSNKRWSLIKQNPDKPRPMPVTNHFARTINANSNQLGGGKLRAMCIPNDDSDKNRRAAQFAEKAIDAIDEESGMNVQNPLLAKHVALWGIGVTKDIYDQSSSNGTFKLPVMGEPVETPQLGCLDCGRVSPGEPGAPAQGTMQAPCPQCGSPNTAGWVAKQPTVQETKEFYKGKVCTEVRPIFEFFLPRDCMAPNLAKKMQHRYRKPLSEAKRIWPDMADDLVVDIRQDTSTVYLEALRSLVNYNYMQEQSAEALTITETYVDWDQLPEDLQEKLEEVVQAGEDDEGIPFEAPDPDLDPIDQLHQWGIYIIHGGGKVLDRGINPLEGEKPYTFFLWQTDPANVYPMGMGSDLIPLQKRLNRLDSLIELAFMSNAAGKWLWPSTQTTGKPTGSPTDVIEYEPIGDGKVKPEFVQPNPIAGSAFALRQAIKQDFLEIGMTEGVAMGHNPQGVTAFRGLAYLGAKAAEQITTQRQLWERAHAMRHKKCLILAKKFWSEPRRTKVAGFNGRWGMKQFQGSDLEGDYTNTIVENSSRPKTIDEKQGQFAMLVKGGLIDPTDPSTREYVLDEMNLDRVNLTDHLQYEKAERDLESVINGQMPALNPFINLAIFMKIFSNFTLTEEFEEVPQDAQQRVMQATQLIGQQMAQQQAQAEMQQMRMQATQKLAGAMAEHAAQPPAGPSGLNGVPGKTTSPEASSSAAESEGNQMASAMP
jgi:hypothetical protein